MDIKNLKSNFSICEDESGNLYALDHVQYSEFLSDHPFTGYNVHPVDKEGFVDYNTTIKMKRGELTPR